MLDTRILDEMTYVYVCVFGRVRMYPNKAICNKCGFIENFLLICKSINLL